MKTKMNKERKYEVFVGVTLFITRNVTASSEEEAHKLAEDSIDLKTITKTWEDGDFEIECHGLDDE